MGFSFGISRNTNLLSLSLSVSLSLSLSVSLAQHSSIRSSSVDPPPGDPAFIGPAPLLQIHPPPSSPPPRQHHHLSSSFSPSVYLIFISFFSLFFSFFFLFFHSSSIFLFSLLSLNLQLSHLTLSLYLHFISSPLPISAHYSFSPRFSIFISIQSVDPFFFFLEENNITGSILWLVYNSGPPASL